VNSYTAALSHQQAETLREVLDRQGYDFEAKPYSLFAARKGKLTVTVYEKGPKVLIQGKETEDFIRFTLEPEVTGVAKLGYEEVHDAEHFAPHFGVDESGKGDYFGPLVIAGVYTDAEITRGLIQAGIMDSKRITSANRIRQLAAKIRDTPGCITTVVVISPEKYNTLHASFKNLNRMLAWGHAQAIQNLVAARPACPRALSDQFARPEILQQALQSKGLTLKLDQRTKGESDTAVAAASILAREAFIDWIDKTSSTSGTVLPLGASAAVIHAAREWVAREGPDALAKVAKLHFKTTESVMAKSNM
jgi:ribonuclease HIII